MPSVYCIGSAVVTPLGNEVEAVFQAVRQGRSALRQYPAEAFATPEPFFASLFPLEGRRERSLFVDISVQAARKALQEAGVSADSPRLGLVLCSVKGEIEALGRDDVTLAASARKIADELGLRTPPLVVSNACISGLAGLIEGRRLLMAGVYDQVLVVGAEVQSRFIVSGFQSLKALSDEGCKPFDATRKGLNLGEAAAAMVLSANRPTASGNYFSGWDPKNQFPAATANPSHSDEGPTTSENNFSGWDPKNQFPAATANPAHGEEGPTASENYFSGRCQKNQFSAAIANPTRKGCWELVEGVIRNDANHISGPSRTGEGSYQALSYLLPLVDRAELAFVSVHGTATLYNDEMESIALDRAGLSELPISALKGTFGHTMGAAGILESILGMRSLEEGVVLPVRGFENLGVSRPLRVSGEETPVQGRAFIKLLSGFGGVNGALLFRRIDA